ncbi:hypothetical protein BDF22DRAFT_382005 [Syncephalis plumigaleata]|nr:hypothetical protein BDF22DRAFT_382005 [Syncephalis plumigaleata]
MRQNYVYSIIIRLIWICLFIGLLASAAEIPSEILRKHKLTIVGEYKYDSRRVYSVPAKHKAALVNIKCWPSNQHDDEFYLYKTITESQSNAKNNDKREYIAYPLDEFNWPTISCYVLVSPCKQNLYDFVSTMPASVKMTMLPAIFDNIIAGNTSR